MKNERKVRIGFAVFEVRDGLEFPIVNEDAFTKQDIENILLELYKSIGHVAKYWDIDLDAFAEKQIKLKKVKG